VLWCLVRQAGQLVSKDTLLEMVWPETAVSEGVLAVCIRHLRRVLGDDPRQPRYIETVHTRGYRFVAPVEGREAPGPAPEGPPAPRLSAVPAAPALVGRDAEVAQVQACLARARGGQRQVLFVTGEAGIGKTTLVEACVQAVEAHGGGWIGWGQCIESYGPGTGYLPVLEALGRLCRGPTGATVRAQLQQWAPTWLVQLSGVLPVAEQARLQRRTLGATRERLFQELAQAFEALTQAQLGVLVLEDLHWSDPSTVDVLTMLARRREAAQLVILGTYRPVELILRAHPLKAAATELHLHGHCAELALPYLAEAAVAAYVAQHFPAPVAQSVAPVIYQRTAGQPLFMVHLAAYLAQQAGRAASADAELAARVAAAAEAVPSGVQQLIELQLGHLRAEEQDVLALASVVGVEFAVASVAAGLQTALDRPEAVCEALARRGQFLEACGLAMWPDGTVSGQYRFRHTVYQQVLYRQVAAAQRVQGHRRIGTRLEVGYGAQTAEIAAALAMHFERGRDYQRAVPYLQQAAENATQRHAPHEVIALVTKGLELLATLPETRERVQREVDLLIALGAALRATKGQGAPEIAQTYKRARQLCHHLNDPHRLFLTLRGLWNSSHARAELQTAQALGEQLLTLAQQGHDTAMRMAAHMALGTTLFMRGAAAAAHTHFAQAIALYDAHQHRAAALLYGEDVGVTSHSRDSWTLWYLGYPDQALAQSQAAVTLAQQLAHPLSLSFALGEAAVLHQFCHEWQAAQAHAAAARHLATDHGFPHWRAYGAILHGWALVHQGEAKAGIEQLHQGMMARRTTGAALARPYFLSLLAEAHRATGQPEAGLMALTEAFTLVETSGECWYVPELYRLKGTLLLQQSPDHHVDAEVCFQHAIRIAQSQHAKSLELRAATSLARLWQQQGKRTEAYELLAPIYGWFTEGFDTADLQDAQTLLQALEAPPVADTASPRNARRSGAV
jgi:predicted ATPase